MAEGARGLKADIFCAVIDNYGDIGVCWRLARQLFVEHGIAVRLWVDDLASLQRIAPEVDSFGVEVRSWETPFPQVEPADLVIEAFACELPTAYVARMAGFLPHPVWINLEYLSAENWVENCHLGQSRHPFLPLTKNFFFPGFTPRTGGLIRESGLDIGFDAARFWADFGLPIDSAEELRFSLFGYDNSALESLLQQWADGSQPVTCVVPQGILADRAKNAIGNGRGRLRLHEFAFLPQQGYDRLLRACDCNFVRGEDSFVRAQWAGKPFVWQIYPQQNDAHLVKLEAFLERYCQWMPAEAESAVRGFWLGWNGGKDVDWMGFWKQRNAITAHGTVWKLELVKQKDLASNLVDFCKNRL